MTVSTIGVADAGTPDKYLHTNQRTISSTAREDQYVLPGEGAYPTYSALVNSVAIDTVNDHLLQVMGDGSNYTRICRIYIKPYFATAAGRCGFDVYRLSTAGTGGTAVTPAPYDTADTYGGGAMTLPSSKGTLGANLLTTHLWLDDGSPTAASAPFVWTPPPGGKPIIIGTATTSGIAINNTYAVSGGRVDVVVEFYTTSFL